VTRYTDGSEDLITVTEVWPARRPYGVPPGSLRSCYLRSNRWDDGYAVPVIAPVSLSLGSSSLTLTGCGEVSLVFFKFAVVSLVYYRRPEWRVWLRRGYLNDPLRPDRETVLRRVVVVEPHEEPWRLPEWRAAYVG
jgi:hypothetical protein